ncbi:D-Ala-D-Ala carboxypeptidase family metallohydrolase [Microbulbifer sp. YPW16]|uniref:D-Ala-D-Ala carboxypeptidase family metallohydrolase n=1 Tax=Microbulbifer sp. YPW16 TaxID=2904242 RepID=UPI001E57C82B|nr:D-Ala-D-Ala carboxypeptidase family metallohydrolase [Microbulbifer sp. YPW16]UHQ53799.1 D-Ala-D-Ala carboxypeptidase family metallohydrolase [Microbulbifer sp. YPW16]
MPAGQPFSSYRTRPPGQRTNRLVIAAIVLILLGIVGGLWLYLYFKALEKPYRDVQGYRVPADHALRAFLRQGDNRTRMKALEGYLRAEGAGDVVEAGVLFRQGSDWLDINEPPFAIPPRRQWENMVNTLALVRDELVPAIGPVEILSAYRTDSYNRKGGGAGGSKHREFCGLDLVPLSNISHKELVEELKMLHARLGEPSRMGLGIYSNVRFHIDTCGYRSW